MPHANYMELQRCLEDCITYCDEYPDRPICKRHKARLVETLEQLQRAKSITDREYASWRHEFGENKNQWKQLSKTLKEVQRELNRIDASGFPQLSVGYWDEQRLEDAVKKMQEYLEQNREEIPFADEYLDKFERMFRALNRENKQTAKAFDSFIKYTEFRRKALSQTNHVIADFRSQLRDELGEKHPEYKSIRWAHSVSPDESVL